MFRVITQKVYDFIADTGSALYYIQLGVKELNGNTTLESQGEGEEGNSGFNNVSQAQSWCCAKLQIMFLLRLQSVRK